MECDSCDGTWYCDGTECPLPPPNYECPGGSYIQCTASGWQCVSQGSPIIIDTKGEGFHLTNLQNGVKFAFFPGKTPVQMSWTNATYSNGFLVLDRNGDGMINDGSELFGSEAPQPANTHPNGFNALAVYDLSANGGNANGMIDPGDAVWSQLRVWIDSNHDGVSQPNELHPLSDFRIDRIGLRYRANRYIDQFGNQFRYEADLWDLLGRKPDRFYDVMLLWTASDGSDAAAREGPWTPTLSNRVELAGRRSVCKRSESSRIPPA